MVSLTLDYVKEVIERSRPEKLTLPVPPRTDHADHIVKTALAGHTKLAADHILYPEMVGKLYDVIGAAIRQLNLEFVAAKIKDTDGKEEVERKVITRYRCYDVLLEMAFNLFGIESKRVGFSSDEVEKSLRAIYSILKRWEEIERKEYGSALIAKATIEEQLRSMKIVNKGNSMLAYMASEVEKQLDENNLLESYLNAMRKQFETNIYYVATLKGMCKFGNDYALGLRWLRHLGYVQVSTNPVLAARAYDDDPRLWELFKEYAKDVLVKEHPEWFKEPDKYADDIAMEATRFALMDNFLVFRPVFFWSRYHDGLVSYQLNPLIAHDVEKSVEAALTFYMRTQKDLKVYDEYLLWGYTTVTEKGRPNIVIKVAAAYPAAIEIAERLNELGIGQNITVSYTVAQEVLIGVAAMRGMAKAIKAGILVTQTYDTNMGGRLEDHLRETIASDLLLKGLEKVDEKKREAILEKLAKALGVPEDKYAELMKLPLKERIEVLCSKKILGRNLLRDAFVEALLETGAYGDKESLVKMLSQIENDLHLSGTFVAHRVYEILFAPGNREKWIEYLMKEVGVTREEAEMVVDRIDLLPASKRHPSDTLLTFARRNMTNTEFPNHQLKVLHETMKPGFRLEDYEESVMKELDPKVLERLMQYEDFVKAYEASPEVNELLKKVGIELKYGNRGLKVEEWPKYGPCVKTMKEFTEGYLKFRDKCVQVIKELAKELGTS